MIINCSVMLATFSRYIRSLQFGNVKTNNYPLQMDSKGFSILVVVGQEFWKCKIKNAECRINNWCYTILHFEFLIHHSKLLPGSDSHGEDRLNRGSSWGNSPQHPRRSHYVWQWSRHPAAAFFHRRPHPVAHHLGWRGGGSSTWSIHLHTRRQNVGRYRLWLAGRVVHPSFRRMMTAGEVVFVFRVPTSAIFMRFLMFLRMLRILRKFVCIAEA